MARKIIKFAKDRYSVEQKKHSEKWGVVKVYALKLGGTATFFFDESEPYWKRFDSEASAWNFLKELKEENDKSWSKQQ